MTPDLRERMANVSHEIWSHWMKYLFTCGHLEPDGSFVIQFDKVERWHRQMLIPYEHLSEKEKDSDREQADKILLVFDTFMKEVQLDKQKALDKLKDCDNTFLV